jgi:hypothetical protein
MESLGPQARKVPLGLKDLWEAMVLREQQDLPAQWDLLDRWDLSDL